MLYYLFDWLHKLNFPGAGMFGYTSFRALMAIILALLISSIWGDKFIKLLKRKQITETQRDAKIDPFGVNKVGVPSMGGVIIIVAILIPCLLLGKLHNIYMILMLITPFGWDHWDLPTIISRYSRKTRKGCTENSRSSVKWDWD